jgi:hypothetical protein
MSEQADELKVAGNAFFRSGDLAEARDKYSDAIALQGNAVYFSNRAACFLLLGRYEDAVADVEAALEAGAMSPKLLGKTLVRGVTGALWAGNDIAKETFCALLENHDAALARKTIKKAQARKKAPHAGNGASFGELPRLRASFSDAAEFYNVGHDSVANALQVGETELDVQLDEDGVPLARMLMCGFGDARHVFHTIGDAPSDTKLHFTLVDVHELVVARFVVMFDLMMSVQHDDEGSVELLARAFCTNVLSVDNHQRLMGVLESFVKADSCPHAVLGISDETWASLKSVYCFWQDTGLSMADLKMYIGPQGVHEEKFGSMDIEDLVSIYIFEQRPCMCVIVWVHM